MLSRLRLSVARYAGVGETVLVARALNRGSLASYRKFELLDQETGQILARATTAWVVLDLI